MNWAYYNEIDPYCSQWLRNLIKSGHIAPGEVDERSITEVKPDDLRGFDQCHFFAGIGGWSVALRLAGWPDDRKCWTGSPPCQPFSVAGKQAGFSDERDLFPVWAALIQDRKPQVVFGEQVASSSEWLDRTKNRMEEMGYAFGPFIIPASCVGAWHKRERTWFVADSQWDEQSWKEPRIGEAGRMGREQQSFPWNRGWKDALSALRVVDDGIQRCVEATDAARNAIVPQVAAEVIGAYMDFRP